MRNVAMRHWALPYSAFRIQHSKLNKDITMKKILIVGSGGQIGTELVRSSVLPTETKTWWLRIFAL